MTVKIYKQYGSSAVDLAKKNPYRLCDEVEGIGFERADQMAMSLGLDPGSEDRIMSGIRYLLTSNASRNGHVCLPREKLTEAAAELLRADGERVRAAMDTLLDLGTLVSHRFEGCDLIYDREVDRQEKYIADKLILLDKLCPAVDAGDVNAFITREEREQGMSYAREQKQAIMEALSGGVMLLTGGPGTGKTTVVHALLHIFRSMDMSVALCAPTGRAAKRLSESTSTEAKTIHRLLEMEFEEGAVTVASAGTSRTCWRNPSSSWTRPPWWITLSCAVFARPLSPARGSSSSETPTSSPRWGRGGC